MAKLVIMPGPSVKDYKLENPRIFQNTTYMYNYQYIDPFAITTDITDQCRRKNDKSRSVVTAAEILIDKGLMKKPEYKYYSGGIYPLGGLNPNKPVKVSDLYLGRSGREDIERIVDLSEISYHKGDWITLSSNDSGVREFMSIRNGRQENGKKLLFSHGEVIMAADAISKKIKEKCLVVDTEEAMCRTRYDVDFFKFLKSDPGDFITPNYVVHCREVILKKVSDGVYLPSSLRVKLDDYKPYVQSNRIMERSGLGAFKILTT